MVCQVKSSSHLVLLLRLTPKLEQKSQHYYVIGEEFRYDQIKVDKTTAGNLNEKEKCELQRYELTFLS